MSASDGDLIGFRCACGKKLKLPATAAGRLARCPKCGQPVRVPDAPAIEPPPITPPPNVLDEPVAPGSAIDDLLLEETRAPAAPRAPQPPARQPPVGPAARTPSPRPAADTPEPFQFAPLPPEPRPGDELRNAELTQACPACGRGWPGVAKVCTDCGVYLATGKTIVITQEDDLDETYMKAQSFLWLWSWVNPIGLFPLKSEAFGLRRPYVIRSIALLTIVTSIAFLFAVDPDSPSGGPHGHLMLWCGQRDVSPFDWADYAAELRDSGFTETETATAIAAAKREYAASQHDFSAYQYLTHQFLHADLWHLIGNLILLFLLGSRVNALLGQVRTVIVYPILGIIAGIAHQLSAANDPWAPALGASGAIAGLAGMYLVLFPAQKIHMVFWWRWGLIRLFELHLHFFAVRGFWVVLWYFGFDVLFVIFDINTGVAYWAHLGGFAAGMLVATLLLITRQVNAHGSDLLSVLLGRYAWGLIGRPRAV